MQYGIAQAKARFSELTHLVDTGQEVVIAKHGRPSYRLVRVSAAPMPEQHSALRHTPKPVQTLLDMQASLHTIRSKTLAPAVAGNFVAQWRQESRY